MIPVARPLLGEEEITAAVGVLRSGQVVQGRQVAAFEDEFSALGDVGAELGEFPGNDRRAPPGRR